MDILCFGDSITRGENDHLHGGWADRLKLRCLARFVEVGEPETCVFNLGIGGETTTGLRRRFSAELEARRDQSGAALVLLAYGANDAAESSGAFLVPVAEYERNLAACLDEAQGRARVLLINVTPVADAVDGVPNRSGRIRRKSAILEYNRALARLGESRGIGVVDVHGAFLRKGPSGLLTPDGVHPNPAGHEVVLEAVVAALRERGAL